MTVKTVSNREIEYLTTVSVTSLTRDGALWVHHDLKGRKFSDCRQTLTAADLRETTAEMDAPEPDELDEDAAANGYEWEELALRRVA